MARSAIMVWIPALEEQARRNASGHPEYPLKLAKE
jgi:hypothetical protein